MSGPAPAELADATRFLAERYGSASTDVALLGGGDWSRAFSFRLAGQDLVARFGVHVEDFRRDRQATAFDSRHLPVPPVMEIGEALGGYYAISERRFGTFLEELDGAGWRAVMPALLRGLDALRAVQPPGIGVDWSAEETAPPLGWREFLLGSLEDRPGGRVSGWRARLREHPPSEEVFVAGERALRELLPARPETRHVIHRDLLNRNVLVSPNGERLEAVFDWGCSVAGDFLYEVAWFTFWAPWYPALDALDFRQVVREHYRAIGLTVENFDERLGCYELQIGLEHIAYSTFAARDSDREDVVRRTMDVLRRAGS